LFKIETIFTALGYEAQNRNKQAEARTVNPVSSKKLFVKTAEKQQLKKNTELKN